MRLVVRAGDTVVTREATGFGHGIARLMTDAHEIALKSAETDATKRALATFGNRFGLSLYGGTKSEPIPVVNPKSDQPLQFAILGPDGTVLVSGLSPEAYASGLRQVIEKAASAEAIDGIISHNTQSLASLKNVPTLISRAGRHFSDILEELAASRKEKLSRTDRNSEDDDNFNSSQRPEPSAENPPIELKPGGAETRKQNEAAVSNIDHENYSLLHTSQSAPDLPRSSRISSRPVVDKSILTYALERRIRNKQHLSSVGSQPCAICADLPCHAHHITFAQPRGLSMKVSDEFTVPLCAAHHNELHRSRAEKAWWKDQGVEPLTIAAKLWEETLRRLTAPPAMLS